MIIPDGHEQPKKKTTPRKSTRVSVVQDITVSPEYQSKVNAMLLKMEIDQVIRIARVCKPDNQPTFIQAIKNFIQSTPYGGGILFTNDWTGFKRHRMFHELESHNEIQGNRSTRDPKAINNRNRLIRWFRIFQKTFDNQPFTITCARYNDPNKAINNMINNTKHSRIGSAPFNAAINHLESIKSHLTQ